MPPFIVSGVQAKLLDEARSGIFPGAWANAVPPAQVARAAPARIPTHRALRANGLRTGVIAKHEIICSPRSFLSHLPVEPSFTSYSSIARQYCKHPAASRYLDFCRFLEEFFERHFTAAGRTPRRARWPSPIDSPG